MSEDERHMNWRALLAIDKVGIEAIALGILLIILLECYYVITTPGTTIYVFIVDLFLSISVLLIVASFYITQRKKEEEALRESEEKFRNIFESAKDCMIYLDKSGRILDVNKKTVEVFGGSEKELLGKHFTKVSIFSSGDMPALGSTFANILAGKEDNINICIKNKKGQEISLECSASLMKTDGKIVGMMVIARDVTKRKKAEEALKDSEQKLRDVIDTSPDAIVWVDTAGKITLVNRKGFEITGFSGKDLIGKNFMDVEALTQESKEKILEGFMKRLEGMDIPPYEVEIVTKNGEVIPAEISASPIYEGDKIVGTQSIFRDLRERKKAEETVRHYSEHLEELVEERTKELRESQERLIKAERLAAIGELATMVGHDLRNPLSAIQNACYYVKTKLGASKDEKLKKMFEVTGSEINHANKIVKDLLDFSRFKKPELKKVDLISSIQDALVQLKFPENIALTRRFSEVPTIEADPDQLRRVFENIALNGTQAMPDGGELTVSTRKNGDFVEVAFTDNGIGIPKENIEKLFTPLFTTKAQGVGLGLAICKNLVESHNGRIEVRSKVGEGSTFTVKLPIHQTIGGEKQT